MSDSHEHVSIPLWLKARRVVERWLVYLAVFIFRRISRKNALAFGRSFGRFIFILFKRYRRVAIDCIGIAFRDFYNEKEKEKIAFESMKNLVCTLIDLIKFQDMTRDEIVGLAPVVIGHEHFEKAFNKSDGGIIGLTAHLGNWEYCGAWIVASGWNLVAVGKAQRDPGVTRVISELREKIGIQHVFRARQGNMETVRALKTKNTVLGLLSDQNGGKDGIFVDFFGIKASTIRGPAFLAMRYNVPVVPIFALWDGDNYRIEILPEIELVNTGDESSDELENSRRMQAVIEEMVRKYPEQWLWTHRRWKTRPAGENPVHRV